MDDHVLALFARQHGLAARRQLIADCGLSNNRVTALVRSRRLVIVARGVLALPGAPRTPEHEAMLAMLRCGPNARLIGPRMLHGLGLAVGGANGSFGVLVPDVGRRFDLRVFDRKVLVAHDPEPADRTDHLGAFSIPAPGRLMVEVARFLEGADLRAAIDAGRRRRRPTLEVLHEAVLALPYNYVPAARMRRVLSRTDDFRLESEGERDLRAALGPLAVEFLWQHWVAPHIRVDAYHPGSLLVLEYDGGDHHDGVDARARDRDRDTELVGLGLRPVHVTKVDTRAPRVLQRRVRALMAV